MSRVIRHYPGSSWLLLIVVVVVFLCATTTTITTVNAHVAVDVDGDDDPVASFSGIPTTIWPQPSIYHVSVNSSTLGIVSDQIFSSVSKIKITPPTPDAKEVQVALSKMPILQRALTRYTRYVFPSLGSEHYVLSYDQANRWSSFIPRAHQSEAQGLRQISIQSLNIVLKSQDTSMVNVNTDESYELEVPDSSKSSDKSTTVTITAQNQWGAVRALETLAQLIVPTVVEQQKKVVLHSIPSLPVSIQDKPRYQWRGIMIDLARHFLPVEQVLSIIDAMSYEKFNKLHLHLIDAQSFPVEIPQYEALATKGSFAPGLTYSTKQMKHIVSYANERGIEVIPEFDMPGHAASWSHAYPDAVSTCKPGTTNINNFPVQPAKEITYQIIDAMAGYSQDTFGDAPYFHIGSDEVVRSCWAQDETVKKFMESKEAKEQGILSMDDLYGYFQKRVEEIARKYNRTMIAWEELALNVKTDLYHYPTEDAIVQVWQLSKTLNDSTALGYKSIMSAGFYLDKQKPDPTSKERWLWGDTWEDMYANEPHKFVSEPKAQELILGVEACMWGEQVTQLNIEDRIWPRVSAVSERGWSEQSVNNADEARERLIHHVCATLIKRGIRAGPIRPDYCPYVYKFDEIKNSQMNDFGPGVVVRGMLFFSVLVNAGLLVGLIICVILIFAAYRRYNRSRYSQI